MNCTSELGISPALLQAINYTLKSSAVKSLESGHTGNQNKQFNRWTMSEKLQPPIKEESNFVLNGSVEKGQVKHFCQSSAYQNSSEKPENNNSVLTDREIKKMIKWKLGQRAVQQEEKTDTIIITSAEADINMVNVLTALATHHMKANNKTDPEQVQEVVNKVVNEDPDSKQQQVIICYNNDDSSVPSPHSGIMLTESDENGQTVIVQQTATIVEEELPATRSNHYDGVNIAGNAQTELHISPPTEIVTAETSREITQGPCPICGDAISGYHYGIFSCESCKGFFKRTVQNRKSFICHRNGDCDINKYNRKKCPACRFAKCIVNGMKLEAIRLDRARGGRSSYTGCSPHGRSKPNPSERKPQKIIRKPSTIPRNAVSLNLGANLPGSHLVAIFKNKLDSDRHEVIKPCVPQLLTDIMNLESLLGDDDPPSEFSNDKLSAEDPDIFMSLMQLTELRLYKLVRWARNLAQFASIGTDDQIVLLQHCWCDLLTFGASYHSISTEGEIQLPYGKSLNSETVEKIGAQEIFTRITNLSEQLRRLQLDEYEYVALKVIILMCPDVKNLKDTKKIQEQQTRICDALALYTSTHFPQSPNKFGEMLLRLPEVCKISMVGKDIMSHSVPSNPTSCGLLLELLKGDSVKDI